MSRGRRINGAEYVELLQELAAGMPHEEIAERHDRAWGTIDNFMSQHRREVEEIRTAQAKVIDSIWIVEREKRLADLAIKHDLLDELLDKYLEDCEKLRCLPDSKTIKTYTSEMRAHSLQAAQESGQLPTRMPNEGPTPTAVGWTISREGSGDAA